MTTPICVVRVQTEAYQRGDTYFLGKSIREMKKLSEYLLLSDEVSNIGVLGALSNILNLDEVDTGLYYLVACNISTDIESGYIDDWDLKLIPYETAQTL